MNVATIVLMTMLHLLCGLCAESICRHHCNCSKDYTYVDCSSSGLTEVPQLIPNTVRFLNLNNNRITSIGISSFKGLVNVRRLSLDNVSLSFIEKGSFHVLRQTLYTLSLSQNKLKKLEWVYLIPYFVSSI